MEIATKAVDEGNAFDIVYFDFSKAFDKVPTERLLSKLKAFGILGHLLFWIRNWLTGRRQRTVIGGATSEWRDVLSGVPQGSVLGPVLFILFNDDIDLCIALIKAFAKFADDIKSGNTIMSQSDAERLQTCIDSFFEWAKRWEMVFNIPKCKVLHLGRTNPGTTYFMNGQPLQVVDQETDIGVLVTKNLKPSDHCAKIAQVARQVLGQVLRSFHFRDKKVFPRLYTTYVRPHLEFASPTWSPWLRKDIDIIENVQRKFIRNVSGLSGSTYAEKLAELGLLSLEDRRKYLDLVEVHKIVTGRYSTHHSHWFELVGDSARRPTRATQCPLNIVPQRCNLEIRSGFFSNRVVEPWNNLPSELKMARTTHSFKGQLKQYMGSRFHDE